MESTVFKWSKKITRSPKFRILQYKDAIYWGLVDSDTNLRNGKGVMVYESGWVYEGEFEQDVWEGHGYEKYDNQNIYIGYFKKGKAHGKGLYTWANGEYYEGEWNMG